MKTLKHIVFSVAIMSCFSMAAVAQTQDKEKEKPKKDPPVVVVKEKERPKEDKPKNDNVKKPGMMSFILEDKVVIGSI